MIANAVASAAWISAATRSGCPSGWRRVSRSANVRDKSCSIGR
jgi:hypothetical protein